MIPKIIHYCWFGGSPLPRYAQRCIESWRKFFPDYEIKEWNESNFDVNMSPYTQAAFAAKKYAFVSDFARFWILSREGGLYFDTDVEICKSFDDVIDNGAFMGVETIRQDAMPLVNPGLALGAEIGNPVIKSLLDYYWTLPSCHFDSKQPIETVVVHTTRVLARDFSLKGEDCIQRLNGITIYPIDYFNPFDDLTGVLNKTENTHSIHWFAKSWQNAPMWYFRLTRMLHRLLGVNTLARLKSLWGNQ